MADCPGFTPPPYATVPSTPIYTAFQWFSVTGSYGFPAEVDYNDPEFLRIFSECYKRELRKLQEQPLAVVPVYPRVPQQLQPPNLRQSWSGSTLWRPNQLQASTYIFPCSPPAVSQGTPHLITFRQQSTTQTTKGDAPIVRLKIKDDNIDLANYGLASESYTTDVGRLFGLFREVYRALNCRFIGFDEGATPSFSRITAPFTQNIEKQLRNMRIVLSTYVKNLRASVQENKFFDLAMHAECVRSLNILEMMQEELRVYESLNMDYENGKFRWKLGEEKAKSLEWLLGRMIQQIRDCFLLVHLFDWAKKKNKVGLNNLNGMYEQGKQFEPPINTANHEKPGDDGNEPQAFSPQPGVNEVGGRRLYRGPGQ